jgi:hypothetical protein
MIPYSNPFLRRAQDKLAQGDNHSKRKIVFMIATISIKLFQTAILMVKEQNASFIFKDCLSPELAEGLL